MTEQGITPVTQHFVTFLGACCGAPLSARETQQAFARALAFCGAAGGDCSVYAALLKFCVAQDIPEKAVDVWRAIVKVHPPPTRGIFEMNAAMKGGGYEVSRKDSCCQADVGSRMVCVVKGGWRRGGVA